jgi:hypothetical protein
MRALLSVNDVARIFEVEPDIVRQWYEQGEIRASRVGLRGGLKFLHEDVTVAYLTRSIRKCLEG